MKAEIHDKRSFEWLFIPMLLGLFFLMSFCSNEKNRKSLHDLNAYVKEHRDSVNSYVDRSWEEMDEEFTAKRTHLEEEKDKMSREMKDSYRRTVTEWDAFKDEHQRLRAEKITAEKMKQLRASLFPDNIDADLTNISSANIASVYDHFVNRVDNNKDIYSKQEWYAVNDSWKLLNETKDRIDENISKADQGRITKIKLRYAGIKAMNKPFAGQG